MVGVSFQTPPAIASRPHLQPSEEWGQVEYEQDGAQGVSLNGSSLDSHWRRVSMRQGEPCARSSVQIPHHFANVRAEAQVVHDHQQGVMFCCIESFFPVH